MRRILIVSAVMGLVASLTAAPVASAPAFASSFQKPPAAAAKALKATVGTSFKEGIVFVDGRYLPPPYKVDRYGTVLRINGVQVTGELIPWNEFVKTQSGVTVSKSESEPAEETPASEPEPEPEEELEEEDDSESSLDDLFDDEPTPKKAKKPAAKRRTASRPKPKKPTVTVTYSFDGEFVPNDQTKAYVDKINRARTRLDKHLRAGGYYCFGSKYQPISGDSGAARHLMEKLPEIMRDSSSPEAFRSKAFSAGFAYMPENLLADLYRNRYAYTVLIQRRKAMQEDRKWTSLLGGGL